MKELVFIHGLKEFYDSARQKKCVCFGAGKKLDEMCRDIPELSDLIAYVVDNNPALDGSERTIDGKQKKVYSVNHLISDNTKNVLIIITSSYQTEIITQLNAISEFDDVEFCRFEKLFDNIAWNAIKPPMGFRKNNTPVIPKIIHYCWFGGADIPDRLKEYIEGWKKRCPDYEFMLWNEENYDVSKNEYISAAYESGKWSFVTDYVRLDVVYQYGGIYLDTDVELIKRPDELLYNDAYMGFERLSTINSGAGFGAVMGFPILKEMMDGYKRRRFVNEIDPNKMILCPEYETAVLQKHGLRLDGSFQVVDDMSIYPVMYFNAKSLYSDEMKITDETISIHHCTWTWAGEKNKL
ncbi:Glycosyltransferase sugar-binding region containing DXD motif-containing protein [Lachnospiraceae bacterium C10]|nr:Glycosyltransferase sugar-binding region containing DXD motif-containing protein [Lachnospiraceae bacterium C10]